MTDEQSDFVGSPNPAQLVGNAFVHQYYHILHQSPQFVYRFYQNRSKLGRPESHGGMSLVSGMEDIKKKVLSWEYSEFKSAIETVDAQESLDGGVMVLVTGHLAGKDNVSRNFTQSFFLATQEKGYFVLNDMFRFVDESKASEADPAVTNGPVSPLVHEGEPPRVEEEHSLDVEEAQLEDEEVNGEEVYNLPVTEDTPIAEEVPVAGVIVEAPNSSTVAVAELSLASMQAPKLSYAEIVKKGCAMPLLVPTLQPARPAAMNVERQVAPSPAPPSALESVADSCVVKNNSTQETKAEGHSIYIRNFPFNATHQQLEEEFKRFGPIRADGIHIKIKKELGYCYGFVEFEVASAVQSAVEASPIAIGGQQVLIEIIRGTGSRVSRRGRFPAGRGSGYQGGRLRSRGGYGGGRGFGRRDYGNRTGFVNQGGGRGGPLSRGSDVRYQRVDTGGRGN